MNDKDKDDGVERVKPVLPEPGKPGPRTLESPPPLPPPDPPPAPPPHGEDDEVGGGG